MSQPQFMVRKSATRTLAIKTKRQAGVKQARCQQKNMRASIENAATQHSNSVAAAQLNTFKRKNWRIIETAAA